MVMSGPADDDESRRAQFIELAVSIARNGRENEANSIGAIGEKLRSEGVC